MALDRFSNKKEIQETDGVVRGIVWNEADLDILQLDLKNVMPEERPVVEIHLYTIGSESTYITGGVVDDFEIRGNKLHINYGQACQSLGIERGQFEVVVNVYKNLLGSAAGPDLYIKEISDDRQEVWIKALPNTELDVEGYIDSFGSGEYIEKVYETKLDGNGKETSVLDESGNPIILSTRERPLSDDLAVNLGNNKIYKIINQKDWHGENDFVVRLYAPLPDDIVAKQKLWTIEQLSDAYIDNINLSGPGPEVEIPHSLRGPNFNIDTTRGTVTETDFKSWNQLLDANTSTSQQIVDRIFSGSMGQSVNIDYSGFQNFIHFSSATERLANFKYKLGLVEYYDGRISTLNAASGSDTSALQGNVAVNQKRKDDVVGNFDGFERWLYNDSTSSLFTSQDVYSDNTNKDGMYVAEGGFLGAQPYRLTSYPKYLSGSKYYLHSSTSDIGEAWYTGWHTSASFYDNENNNSLSRSIPEHIRLDSNNSEYELFVNMIGHHYDILYTHIENLTKVYKPEEHPKLGQSKDTLYQVAQSLGWTLEDGKQASQLWQYKLGVDSGSGAFANTGDMFSKSDEEITTEVWRRIVNNLPYLLKTKGTTRSVKALMNTYGIPQTLLSIREYGGPKVAEDVPTLIEDRFSYALQIDSGSGNRANIQYQRDWYSSSIDNWGMANNYDSTNLNGMSAEERPADTIEFRFKPNTKTTMTMLSHEGSSADNVHWNLGVQYTGSYSGSDSYGRLFFQMRTYGGDDGGSHATNNTTNEFTDWVPLYDGEFWNVRLWTEFPFVTSSFGTGNAKTVPNIYFQTQKASDYISDKIIHRTSGSLYPGSGSSVANGENVRKGWADANGTRWLALGGSTGSGLLTPIAAGGYHGEIQEYREWMEVLDQKTFNLHTTNPTSYVSSLSATSSYDTLVRHYPFGTDMNAVDHNAGGGLFITSSHPNSTISDFSPPYPDGANQYASASGFISPSNAQRGNYAPVEETYYIQGVSLGGSVPRSQKIRLESNELVRRLSPNASAEKSRFDRASVDTNRVGLFYSAADQINKEIFNHIGDVALDDYVGDPDHEIVSEYPDLSNFSKEYWKKYSDRNDINAYLRIFSQFDFALFNQIEQLLPERVDNVMGLLIEPHALERAKVKLTNRPSLESLHYDGIVPEPIKVVSGDVRFLSASIDMPHKYTTAVQVFNIGDSGYSDTGNHIANLAGENGGLPGGDPYTATVYKHIYSIRPYQFASASAANLGLASEITGTLSPLTYSPFGSIILDQRVSNIFKLVKYYYGTGSATSKYEKNKQQAVSQSLGLSYSQSLEDVGYRDDFFQMTENQRYTGCKLTGPGINVSTTVNGINQGPVIEVFATNPNTLVFNSAPNAQNPGNLEVR